MTSQRMLFSSSPICHTLFEVSFSLSLDSSYDNQVHSAWESLQKGHRVPVIDIYKAISVCLRREKKTVD